jgi:hypothetical protein
MQKIQSLLVLLLLFACVGEGIEGYVGESISITANNPEEGKDVDFSWVLTEQPDGSLINSKDLKTSRDGQKMLFEPDYPGQYLVEVIVSQYSDEISNQLFAFSIVDPESKKEPKIEPVDDSPDEGWLNENIDEHVNIAQKSELKEDIVKINDSEVEIENAVNEIGIDSITHPIVKTPPQIVKAIVDISINEELVQDKTDRYTIQITSKKILRDANKFAQNLIHKGFDAYIQKANFRSDEIWYRVRVGSYNNYSSAKAAADALSDALGMATWVDFVRIEQ